LRILSHVEQKSALSARGVEREYAISRAAVTDAIRRGELPAAQLGSRRLTILRADVERWIRKHAVKPIDFAAARVDEILEREERAGAG
jgi:predicted DNA-binding transcriptional regulator AlpA